MRRRSRRCSGSCRSPARSAPVRSARSGATTSSTGSPPALPCSAVLPFIRLRTAEKRGSMVTDELETRSINVIRALAMDAVQKANSGHPGTPMALAPLADVLWTRVMNYDASEPDWPDRDRFVLSAGHASMLLYSMLYLTVFGLELDDLRNFRQLGSR